LDTHTRVLATFVARPDRIEDLHALLRSLLALTHAEDGCLMYDLWRSTENPAKFVLVEEWTSDAHLDRHLAAPHLESAKNKFPDLLSEPLQIERLRIAGPRTPQN
jgi:quinol monooxygenase YgiN